MVVDTTRESVCVNQIVGQKNENKIIEGDMIVPDIKPDILNTIETNGNICIYKKEVQDGKVKVDGTIQVDIIYLADNEEGSIRSLHTCLDFSEVILVENCKIGMNVQEKIDIISIETKVLNGRKIGVRANISFDIKVYSNENIEIVKEINGVENLQKLQHTIEVNSLIGEGSTKTYAKETINIDEIDNLAEILKTRVHLQNRDIKISYNKVLVKADAYVKILYLTEDNRISSVESIIPVMGFVDIQNISEEHICDTNYELKNLIVKPNGETEHSIYVEAEIEISCYTFESKTMTIIEDLYSPTECLKFKRKEIYTMINKTGQSDVCKLKGKIVIPELMGNKILDISIKPTIVMINIENGCITYEGESKIKILYWDETENRLDVKQLIMPFHYLIDIPGVEQKSSIETEMETVKQDFIIMPDGFVEISIDICFLIKAANFKKVSVIDEIVKEEKEKSLYSMVIYFVKAGDTLWEIAKKFDSIVEDIVRVNEIENPDLIPIGKQLYIPRYNIKKSA